MTLRLSTMMEAAGQAPFADLDAIIGAGGVVVLAPHPDDESLGCGGLLRAAASAGRRAAVIVVTDGRLSHPSSPSVDADALARLRAQEVRAAVAALHQTIGLIELGFPDCDIPDAAAARNAAAGVIVDVLKDVGATALLTAWGGDPHKDHEATARLARHAAALHPGLRVWSYPVWGRFAPAQATAPGRVVRFDTRRVRAAKAAAIACHRSQMTRMIDDDPQGFVMSAAMQAHFIDQPEVFLAE